MRILAILMILGGLCAGLLLPWAQSNFIGDEIHNVTLYERGKGWRGHRVMLSADQSPLKVKIRVNFVPNAAQPKVVPIDVAVSGADGIVLNGTLYVSSIFSGERLSGDWLRASSSPTFELVESGEYGIEARLGKFPEGIQEIEPAISKVEGVVITGAMEPIDDYKMYGIIVAFAGFYLLMRSRRNRHNKDMTNTEPPQKWGRG